MLKMNNQELRQKVGYTIDQAGDIVEEHYNSIEQELISYIEDNINLDNLGKDECETSGFIDSKLYFNLRTKETYMLSISGAIQYLMEEHIADMNTGNIVSLLSFNMAELATELEHHLIEFDEESIALKDKYKSGVINKDEYVEKMSDIIMNRAVDEYAESLVDGVDIRFEIGAEISMAEDTDDIVESIKGTKAHVPVGQVFIPRQ